jgi:hypothetical protein
MEVYTEARIGSKTVIGPALWNVLKDDQLHAGFFSGCLAG